MTLFRISCSQQLKAETTEPSVEEGSRKGDILATSLSSKFFENLKRSGSSKDSVSRRSSLSGGPKERERERDVHEATEGEVEEDEEESVAALKARLRSIGVLGEPAVASDKLSPLSPSIQRKIDPRAAVNSDDGVHRARRARHKELYLEQEEQLRIKAAHCKEVVRCVSPSPSSLYRPYNKFFHLPLYHPYFAQYVRLLLLLCVRHAGSSTEPRKLQPRPLKISPS